MIYTYCMRSFISKLFTYKIRLYMLYSIVHIQLIYLRLYIYICLYMLFKSIYSLIKSSNTRLAQ